MGARGAGTLRQLHLDALERLVGEHEVQGRWSEAIRHAERLAHEDPLREATHRLLLRLHAAGGDRARGLRAYHVCATALGAPPRAVLRTWFW